MTKNKIIIVLIISIINIANFGNILLYQSKAKEIDNNQIRDIINKNEQCISNNNNFDKHYALIVGVGKYKEENMSLPNPSEDSKDLYTALNEKGWEKNNIHLLLDNEATKENILNNLGWLAEKTGTVLFYFFGHGTRIKDLNGDENDRFDEAICPHDVYYDEEKNIQNTILDDKLQEIVNNFNAEKIVLIFISCFSGGMIENQTAPQEQNNYKVYNPMEELMGNNRVILTATQEYNLGYEYKLLFGQPFSKRIIEALNGDYSDDISVDINNDGFISAEEAFKFAQPRAMLDNALGLPTSVIVIAAIHKWMKGETTLAFVIYTITIYGIMLPIPQIYDGNTQEDIILVEKNTYLANEEIDNNMVIKDKSPVDLNKLVNIKDIQNIDIKTNKIFKPSISLQNVILINNISFKPILQISPISTQIKNSYKEDTELQKNTANTIATQPLTFLKFNIKPILIQL